MEGQGYVEGGKVGICFGDECLLRRSSSRHKTYFLKYIVEMGKRENTEARAVDLYVCIPLAGSW